MRAFFFLFKVLFGYQNQDFYRYYNVRLTWSEAVDFCNEKGGALATFADKAAFDKVRKSSINICSRNKFSLWHAILVAAGWAQLMSSKKANGCLSGQKFLVKTPF